jgi:RNA polymerase sigma-70 factor (ECF subfamily)
MSVNYQATAASSRGAIRLAPAPSTLRIASERQRSSKRKLFAQSSDASAEHRQAPVQQPRWEEVQEIIFSLRSRAVGLAYSILGNQEDAEDAVQNATLSAYLHLRDFEGRSTFATWFNRIVSNSALMIRRKRNYLRVESFPDSGTPEETPWIERVPARELDPEMVNAQAEKVRWVNQRLAEMKPPLRQAFTMVYHEEFSVKEACALLGVPATTFKARVFHAKKLLIRATRRSYRSPFCSTSPLRDASPVRFTAHNTAFASTPVRSSEMSSREVSFR